jgi:riboflavin kinase/FMN adenylyltransferase
VRPTFQDSSTPPVLIETHLLDVSSDLYGNLLEVRFIERIRDEKRFAGIEELKAQIQNDCDTARAILSKH